MGANTERGEAKNSYAEALASLAHDLNRKITDSQEARQTHMNIADFSSSGAQLAAQISFQEVRKVREKELAGFEGKLTEKARRSDNESLKPKIKKLTKTGKNTNYKLKTNQKLKNKK